MSSERLLPLLLLAGCGSLADASWYGDVLLSLEGDVYADQFEHIDAGDLRIALFWSRGVDVQAEQVVVARTSFPARYTLEIYEPPPLQAREQLGQFSVALGRPMLYVDSDGDGRWDLEDEPIVGGSAETVVLYTDAPTTAALDEAREWVHPEVQDGFQRMYASNDPCGDDEIFEPAPKGQTHIVVGNVWSYLWDIDCDNGAWPEDPNGEDPDDWAFDEQIPDHDADGCPPFPTMVEFCDDRGAFSDDPASVTCINQYCPILDAVRQRRAWLPTCEPLDVYDEVCRAGLWDELLALGFPEFCVELLCPAVEQWGISVAEIQGCPDDAEMLEVCTSEDPSWWDDPFYGTCRLALCP